MNKSFIKIVSIIFAFALILTLCVPAFAASESKNVYNEGILSEEEEKELAECFEKRSEELDCDLVALFIKNYEGYKDGKFNKETLENLCQDYVTENSLGRGQKGEAIVLAVVADEGKLVNAFSFGKNYTAADFYAMFSSLITDENSKKENGDPDYVYIYKSYADNVEPFVENEVVATTDNEGNVEVVSKTVANKNVAKKVIIALVIGLLIGLIVATVLKSKLKSVAKQSGAANYVEEGSFTVDRKNDVFLYKKEERTPKPKQEPPKK